MKIKNIILKVLLFIGIYIAIFFVGLLISWSIFPDWSGSESLRNFYHNVSYLTPVIIDYGDTSLWGMLSTQSFNGYFYLINIIYTSLIFYLILKIKNRRKK